MATKILGKAKGGVKLTVLEPFEIPVDKLSAEISEKLDELLNNDKTRLAIMNLFAKTIDPWVPFLEGPLSQTLNITPDYVEYLVPYATRQYFGENFNFTKEHHPLATAKWDEVAMQTQMDSFVAQVEEILRRELNG